MEKLVLLLCGLWLWLTGKSQASHYKEAAEFLSSARLYLISDYQNRASTRDRGSMLPDQVEALSILDEQIAHMSDMARRFESFSECYRFATEELSGPTAKAA